MDSVFFILLLELLRKISRSSLRPQLLTRSTVRGLAHISLVASASIHPSIAEIPYHFPHAHSLNLLARSRWIVPTSSMQATRNSYRQGSIEPEASREKVHIVKSSQAKFDNGGLLQG